MPNHTDENFSVLDITFTYAATVHVPVSILQAQSDLNGLIFGAESAIADALAQLAPAGVTIDVATGLSGGITGVLVVADDPPPEA